ncbi:MAG TPA: MBL fold metallo-hydrolase [Candidatus Saccharimonadales bacterium]|nr:MBL fold metallo-hydrolase [Candidatus Saccharimonadales bacterium]
MKITKYVHSCLLVETDDRVAIFDPGAMSYPVFDISKLTRLDDIFITHNHGDHYLLPFIKELLEKFPNTRITTTREVVDELKKEGIEASADEPEGVKFFDSPHESVAPLFPQPEEVGIHYLNKLSHPGDSHSFKESKEILALPITAPWGSSIKALNLALELKPKHVIPIHDWHWSDEARKQMYDSYESVLGKSGIKMHKPQTGTAIEIN